MTAPLSLLENRENSEDCPLGPALRSDGQATSHGRWSLALQPGGRCRSGGFHVLGPPESSLSAARRPGAKAALCLGSPICHIRSYITYSVTFIAFIIFSIPCIDFSCTKTFKTALSYPVFKSMQKCFSIPIKTFHTRTLESRDLCFICFLLVDSSSFVHF